MWGIMLSIVALIVSLISLGVAVIAAKGTLIVRRHITDNEKQESDGRH